MYQHEAHAEAALLLVAWLDICQCHMLQVADDNEDCTNIGSLFDEGSATTSPVAAAQYGADESDEISGQQQHSPIVQSRRASHAAAAKALLASAACDRCVVMELLTWSVFS